MTELGRAAGLSKIARLDDALALLPRHMDTPRARVMLLAIQLQEDPKQRRRQWPTGTARGLWQFEMGGVTGVLAHQASRQLAAKICSARGVQPLARAVYNALERDDALACALARLLLWTDPAPLPDLGQIEPAWRYYVRNWRPGKPHRERWTGNYLTAVAEVKK